LDEALIDVKISATGDLLVVGIAIDFENYLSSVEYLNSANFVDFEFVNFDHDESARF
jgi:hypothetical protein